MKNPADIVFAFIKKINAHDVTGLCELMTEDHLFIDSLGTVVCGRENMRTGWEGYLNWFPDYQISIHEIFQKDNLVALFGTARGTYCVNGKLLEANKWEIPAAWKAVVKNNLIAEWRVFADNSPVLQILKTNRD